MFGGVYRNKRVLVTGHTGFKGSWLCKWLNHLGAEVFSRAFFKLNTEYSLGLSATMKRKDGLTKVLNWF